MGSRTIATMCRQFHKLREKSWACAVRCPWLLPKEERFEIAAIQSFLCGDSKSYLTGILRLSQNADGRIVKEM